jgi:DnaJ-class molecular chaperone
MVMRDPYDILGVPRTAEPDTIKQAYRRLAKKLHPDVNPGDADIESKFKEVSLAYDLLSDAKKRARFDRGEIDGSGAEKPSYRFYKSNAGRNGGASNGGASNSGSRPGADARGFGFGSTFGDDEGAEKFDPDEVWELFNEGLRRRGGQAGPGQAGAKRRGGDVSYSLTVDFIAATTGTRRRLTLPDGRTLDVAIPPGTVEGAKLRLKGQGQPAGPGGVAGDAYVEIQVEPHPLFQRKGLDIHLDVPVTIQEAALGAAVTVPTIDGKVTLKVPPGSNSGTVLRLKGRGVPTARAGGAGDQYVRLTVMLPERIDGELATFLERWGPRNAYDVRAKLGLDS